MYLPTLLHFSEFIFELKRFCTHLITDVLDTVPYFVTPHICTACRYVNSFVYISLTAENIKIFVNNYKLLDVLIKLRIF